MAYLDGVYKNYRRKADQISWQKENINDLFRDAIKHENDDLNEAYFAALVCRFWGYSGRIYSQCNHHVNFEDCLDCIIDAIRYVLKKRVWESSTSSLYNDKAGPDKAIHIAMKRQKAIMLSKFSAQRRMSNFNTMSLDQAHENYNDSTDGMLFDLETNDDTKTKLLVSSYFSGDKNNCLNGIILDIICYGKVVYSEQNIVKELKKLTKDSINYYVITYNADINMLKQTYMYIKNASNELLEIKVRSLMHTLKREFTND